MLVLNANECSMSLETTFVPASDFPRRGVFFVHQTVLRCSRRASRTSLHNDTPRLRAISFARPFVPCVTRVVIVVGCLRPVDALGADPLDGCELTVCAFSDVSVSERCSLLVSIMTKAGSYY